jgi:hypothetical protein
MPPDNRVDFTFQKHVLLSLPPNQAEDITRSVGQWLKALCRGDSRFLVIDIGDNDGYFPYYTPLYNRTSPTSRDNIDSHLGGVMVFATPPPTDTYAELMMWTSGDEGRSRWNRIM